MAGTWVVGVFDIRHVHAGAVKPFLDTILDVYELEPEPHRTKIYGMALDEFGQVHDFKLDGRTIQLVGSENEKPPYWQFVCLVEDDLSTLVRVQPAGEEPYWDRLLWEPQERWSRREGADEGA